MLQTLIHVQKAHLFKLLAHLPTITALAQLRAATVVLHQIAMA
jgi:hypothetical protein